MKKVFFLGIAAATMLASCSKDETVDVPQGKAIGFSNTFVDNATRSVVDPSFKKETLDNFAVYGFTQNGQIFDGVPVSSDDGGTSWTYSPTQYWVEGNQYAFAAIAPASVSVSGVTRTGTSVADYKVGMTVSFTNDGKTDLLYANGGAFNADATFMASPDPVSLTFKHQLSKVKFSFKNNVSGAYKIKVTDVKITNAKSTGTLTIGDQTTANTWGNSATGNVSLDFGNVVAAEATGTDVANTAQPIDFIKEGETYNEQLMIPTASTESYNVTFTVELLNGTVSMGIYNHTATIEGVELKLGYCYDFAAELNADNIVVDPDDPDDPDAQLKPITFTVNEISGWIDTDEDKTIDIPSAGNGQ